MGDRRRQRRLTALNAEAKSLCSLEFEGGLLARIVGQRDAVRSLAERYQVAEAGLTDPSRPLATLLFLGPTGSGKTRVVEAGAEILFGDANAMVKVDCAEFQHPHEIARLIGAPPGYLGHQETMPLLSQEQLDRYHTARDPLTFVLFDEIEKANAALWQLLLGILDKGTLTLGNNKLVDFTQTLIVMTSNLGAKEMCELISGSIGFAPPAAAGLANRDLYQKIYRTAVDAARRTFSPEFMNRIDKVVVFRSLMRKELRQILDLELHSVQRRIQEGAGTHFTFRVTRPAKEFLLAEGVDLRYGARHLKRAIDRFVVHPLASLLATGQIGAGDVIEIGLDVQTRRLSFGRDEEEASLATKALDYVGGQRSLNRYAAV